MLYGPTTGDHVRLADTDLLIEVEDDLSRGATPADEVVFGGGKVIRESMGQARATRADGAPDLVITGALVLDHWGIVKADLGSSGGRFIAIGKAGDPEMMDGVDPALVIGPATEVMAGNGRILTAGAVDAAACTGRRRSPCRRDPSQVAGPAVRPALAAAAAPPEAGAAVPG